MATLIEENALPFPNATALPPKTAGTCKHITLPKKIAKLLLYVGTAPHERNFKKHPHDVAAEHFLWQP